MVLRALRWSNQHFWAALGLLGLSEVGGAVMTQLSKMYNTNRPSGCVRIALQKQPSASLIQGFQAIVVIRICSPFPHTQVCTLGGHVLNVPSTCCSRYCKC